eukprot:TRINITY_DN37577_c0_g1_i1.p1 TRINITY_DN37577_c0_g1~~TRINITY_DN37577_c0_g1_i1.p1  ORF type:complete len:444 (-),score=46.09 TRINITY_DN37577_c0_g1_i1:156-1487(-)
MQEETYDCTLVADSLKSALAELQCHVCLETVVLPEATPCGHLFCAPCLRSWLRRSPCCPACKTAVPTEVVCGIRLLSVGNAARALEDSRTPGVYALREREAMAALQTLADGKASSSRASQTTSRTPAAVPMAVRRQRLLQVASMLSPLRLRQFDISTSVPCASSGTWETRAVDFQLERITSGTEWEPDEWCWSALLDLPTPQSSERAEANRTFYVSNSMPPVTEAWTIELRLVVGSHNRILDPADDDERFSLRLEALVDSADGSPAAGHSWWLLLQVCLVFGDDLVALPFAVVLGEPFLCPQILQPAQSSGLASAEITSQDHSWKKTRRQIHCLASDHLVNIVAPLPPAGFDIAAALEADRISSAASDAALASARRKKLETVVSVKCIEFNSVELAAAHADLFSRDQYDNLDAFQMQTYPRGFVHLPPLVQAKASRDAGITPG